jgi:hypothetical protein
MNPAHGRRRPLSSAAALLAGLSLGASVVGCGVVTPTPSPAPTPIPTATPVAATTAPSQDPAAVYAAIEDAVSQIRGLTRKQAIQPTALDDAGMKAFVDKTFDQENPPDAVAADERLAKLLGLIPQTASLSSLYRELLTSQVIGIYSPDDKQLYVLDTTGKLGPSARIVFAHEFDHALQDQHFDLVTFSGPGNDRTQGDRALARLSLVEGDATAVMSVWAQQNLTVQELLQVAQEAADPQAAAIMARMPPILRDGALFPYQGGAAFVASLVQTGGWPAVDRAFTDPPASTEQVMHVAKYTAREAPVIVAVPDGLAARMGDGWTMGTQDTYGEFQLQIWLRGSTGAVSNTSANAAAGWGGDRVVLLDGPGGARAAALLTAWDTPADATEFADAARAAVASWGLNAEIVFQPGSSTVRVLVGSDDVTTGRLHQILGASGV